MTLLRRRPREVYRVYTEEEYLNDAGPDLATLGESPASAQPVSRGAGERRRHRVAGVAMLVGAVAIVGGVVAVNGLRTHRIAGRGHGSLLAATRSKAVRSPVLAGSDTGPSRPAATDPSELARTRVGRDHDSSSAHPRRQANLRAELGIRRHGGGSRHARLSMPPPAPGGRVRGATGTVIVIDDSPGSRSGPSTIAGAPAEGSGTSSPTVESVGAVSSADAPPAHPGPVSGAEFGFEH